MLLSVPQGSSVFTTRLLLPQQPPDLGAQMNKRGLIHHIFDPLMPVPAFVLANLGDVDDLTDTPRAAGHHHDAFGEVDSFLYRMGDEEHRPRAQAGRRATPPGRL